MFLQKAKSESDFRKKRLLMPALLTAAVCKQYCCGQTKDERAMICYSCSRLRPSKTCRSGEIKSSVSRWTDCAWTGVVTPCDVLFFSFFFNWPADPSDVWPDCGWLRRIAQRLQAAYARQRLHDGDREMAFWQNSMEDLSAADSAKECGKRMAKIDLYTTRTFTCFLRTGETHLSGPRYRGHQQCVSHRHRRVCSGLFQTVYISRILWIYWGRPESALNGMPDFRYCRLLSADLTLISLIVWRSALVCPACRSWPCHASGRLIARSVTMFLDADVTLTWMTQWHINISTSAYVP